MFIYSMSWHLRCVRLSFEHTEKRKEHRLTMHKYNYLGVKLNLCIVCVAFIQEQT